MYKLLYFKKYILEVGVEPNTGVEGGILQNSGISGNLSDPLTVAVISAIAGAIAGAMATEAFKALSNIDIFGKNKLNKQAESELVAISIIQAGKLILMTKRNPKPGSNLTWCFPAARVRTNEIIIDRLKERYKQKFNIEVNNIRKVGTSRNIKDDLPIIYFHCQYDRGEVINKDTNENSEVKWVDVDEVEKLVNEVADRKIDSSLLEIVSMIRDQ